MSQHTAQIICLSLGLISYVLGMVGGIFQAESKGEGIFFAVFYTGLTLLLLKLSLIAGTYSTLVGP